MPTRKYVSEFGLGMAGSQVLLLQQDQLAMLEESMFGSGYPCHIYMVARRPRVTLDPASVQISPERIAGRFLIQRGNSFDPYPFDVRNETGIADLRVECPFPHTEYCFVDNRGQAVANGRAAQLLIVLENVPVELLDLEVLYIGQAYGTDGKRMAPERLRHHETLQSIYAEAIRRAPDQDIWLLLWSFRHELIASFDGTLDQYSTDATQDHEHRKQVIEQPISDHQRINFTEAALIRYFQPSYNKEFKDTFPNPAHKSYSECYGVDVNSVMVELVTRDIRCRLWSPVITPRWDHSIVFPLHSQAERRSMFEFFGVDYSTLPQPGF